MTFLGIALQFTVVTIVLPVTSRQVFRRQIVAVLGSLAVLTEPTISEVAPGGDESSPGSGRSSAASSKHGNWLGNRLSSWRGSSRDASEAAAAAAAAPQSDEKGQHAGGLQPLQYQLAVAPHSRLTQPAQSQLQRISSSLSTHSGSSGRTGDSAAAAVAGVRTHKSPIGLLEIKQLSLEAPLEGIPVQGDRGSASAPASLRMGGSPCPSLVVVPPSPRALGGGGSSRRSVRRALRQLIEPAGPQLIAGCEGLLGRCYTRLFLRSYAVRQGRLAAAAAASVGGRCITCCGAVGLLSSSWLI